MLCTNVHLFSLSIIILILSSFILYQQLYLSHLSSFENLLFFFLSFTFKCLLLPIIALRMLFLSDIILYLLQVSIIKECNNSLTNQFESFNEEEEVTLFYIEAEEKELLFYHP